MNSSPVIRIALVDDHVYLRMGLTSLLHSQADMRVVVEAASAEEALPLCLLEKPDIALVDLRMPGMGGILCAERFRQELPETNVIILTTFDSDENLYRAIEAGAQAFLLKDVSKANFLATIREVHAGDYELPTAVARRVAERLREEPVTTREIEILKSVADGMSNKQISSRLCISESTVKGHIKRSMTKLHAKDRTEAVVVALKRGLLALER